MSLSAITLFCDNHSALRCTIISSKSINCHQASLHPRRCRKWSHLIGMSINKHDNSRHFHETSWGTQIYRILKTTRGVENGLHYLLHQHIQSFILWSHQTTVYKNNKIKFSSALDIVVLIYRDIYYFILIGLFKMSKYQFFEVVAPCGLRPPAPCGAAPRLLSYLFYKRRR